jgi:YVTN family beta-propeller protein
MTMTALARRSLIAVAAAASLYATCSQAAPFAYVPSATNQLSVIDTATNTLVTTLPTGANPVGVAVSPAGNRVYVTNLDDGTMSVIDALRNRVLSPVTVGPQPLGLQVSPDGRNIAVATFGPNGNPSHTISIVEGGTGLVTLVGVGSGPSAVAYNPSGSRLYVANYVERSISIVDTASAAVIGTLGVVPNPMGLAMNPAGSRLYVAHLTDSTGARSTLSVIDTTGPSVVTTIPLSADPQWLAVSHDGTRVYVAIGSGNTGTVAVVDTSSNRVLFEILLGTNAFPSGVAVSPDGTKVHVVDSGRRELATYDTTSYQQLSAVGLPLGPGALGDFLGPQVVTNGADMPDALSGIWFNPNESGWGINFTQRGSNIFAAWYTYDSAGNPKWYVAPNCTTAAQSTCSGTLYQVTGPVFFGVTFDPSKRNVTAAGSMSVSFSNNDTGSFTYNVGGIARTVAIQREPLASGPDPLVNYTDLWWNPDEPGWGLAITQQAGVMFAAWYVYDASGNPTWYVVPNCPAVSSGDGCAGDAFSTKGPPFGTSFDSSQVQVFPAGRMVINFSDPNNGQINYLFDNLFVTKRITRELF